MKSWIVRKNKSKETVSNLIFGCNFLIMRLFSRKN